MNTADRTGTKELSELLTAAESIPSSLMGTVSSSRPSAALACTATFLWVGWDIIKCLVLIPEMWTAHKSSLFATVLARVLPPNYKILYCTNCGDWHVHKFSRPEWRWNQSTCAVLPAPNEELPCAARSLWIRGRQWTLQTHKSQHIMHLFRSQTVSIQI